MSYREKSAWVALSAHAILFGAYFGAAAWLLDHTSGIASIPLLLVTLLAFIVITAGLDLTAAINSDKETGGPPGARERVIDHRAQRVASGALTLCVAGLGAALLLGWDGFAVANMLLAAAMLSELAKAITQIASYRIVDLQ